VTKLDWGRKGPPRPGSGLGHPFGAERPYVPPKSEAERKREKEELDAENAKREAAVAPERARQARRDARKRAKQSGFGSLFQSLSAIPKPPVKKS
jgi:hypothetical protein